MTLNSGDQLKYFDYEKRKVMDSTNILNEESCMGKCCDYKSAIQN